MALSAPSMPGPSRKPPPRRPTERRRRWLPRLLASVALVAVALSSIRGWRGGVWWIRWTSTTSPPSSAPVENAAGPLAAPDLLAAQVAFDDELEQWLKSFGTRPPVAPEHRDELTAIGVYLGPQDVLDHVPNWLTNHGYQLSPQSAHAANELRNQWQSLQAGYRQLAEPLTESLSPHPQPGVDE